MPHVLRVTKASVWSCVAAEHCGHCCLLNLPARTRRGLMLNCQLPTRFALGGQNKRGLLLGTPALLPGAGRGRAAVQTRPTAPTCLARAVLAPLLVPHFYPRRGSALKGQTRTSWAAPTARRGRGRGQGHGLQSSCSSLPRCCATDPVPHVQVYSSTARCLQREKTAFQGAIARHSGNNKSTAIT